MKLETVIKRIEELENKRDNTKGGLTFEEDLIFHELVDLVNKFLNK